MQLHIIVYTMNETIVIWVENRHTNTLMHYSFCVHLSWMWTEQGEIGTHKNVLTRPLHPTLSTLHLCQQYNGGRFFFPVSLPYSLLVKHTVKSWMDQCLLDIFPEQVYMWHNKPFSSEWSWVWLTRLPSLGSQGQTATNSCT